MMTKHKIDFILTVQHKRRVDSIILVRTKFEEFKQAVGKNLQSVGMYPRVRLRRGWTPPVRGFLKVNVDAAIRNHGSFLNMVVCNNSGNLVEAHSFKATTRDSMIAELWAVRQAIWSVFIKGGRMLFVNLMPRM